MSHAQSIQQFSTESVRAGMRFDYWMSILNQSLWPVTTWSAVAPNFKVELREASLGCISSMTESICGHHSRRTRADVDNSAESSYHLFVSLKQSWASEHHGRSARLNAGDVMVLGEGEHEVRAPDGFDGIILKCPAHWVHTWLPDPGVLLGRALARDSKWGQVLSPMICALTPDLAAAPPLPPNVIVDQVGAMLALIAGDGHAQTQSAPATLARIRDCVRQRLAEPRLSAADVAASLDIPARHLHRILAAGNTTFAALLVDVRVEAALELLRAASPARPTLSEIGRRVGFSNMSYFTRVLRSHAGLDPLDIQRISEERRP